MKKRKKYYEVLSEKNKYRYGIFPHSKEGREDALKYIKELSKQHKGERFLILEK